MRFRNRHQTSALPTLELTPMLNIMMGILAFFVMVTMLMSGDRDVSVQLPNAEPATTTGATPPLLVVRLSGQGQLLVNDQSVSRNQLAPQMQAFLSSSPQGFVVLQAEPQVPYQQVIELLEQMRAVGGDRVSLAVE